MTNEKDMIESMVDDLVLHIGLQDQYTRTEYQNLLEAANKDDIMECVNLIRSMMQLPEFPIKIRVETISFDNSLASIYIADSVTLTIKAEVLRYPAQSKLSVLLHEMGHWLLKHHVRNCAFYRNEKMVDLLSLMRCGDIEIMARSLRGVLIGYLSPQEMDRALDKFDELRAARRNAKAA